VISQQSGPRDWSPSPSPSPSYDDSVRCPDLWRPAPPTRRGYPRSWRDRFPAWVSVLLGVASVVLALAPQVRDAADASHSIYFSLIGLAAIGYGWHALRLKREGRADSVVAPFFGITFGVVGTVVMATGIAGFYLDAAAHGETVTMQPFGAPLHEPAGVPEEVQAERDSFLESMQTIAGAVNAYAGPEGSWPASLAVTTDGTSVLLPTGEPLGFLPAGSRLSYAPSADLMSYTISITGGAYGTTADYSSDTGVITVG
jgi:hypothetical protein